MKMKNKSNKSYNRAYKKILMKALHKQYFNYCHAMTARGETPLEYRKWLHMPQARI